MESGGIGRRQVVVERPARGRGRGRGGRTTAGQRTLPIDEMKVVSIDQLPVGIPLEHPLHPKRRRTWPPSQPSTSNSATACEDPAVRSPSPAMFEESDTGSPAILSNLGTPANPPSPTMFVECTSWSPAIIHLGTPVGSPAVPPSPAMIDEYSGIGLAGPSTTSSRRRTLNDAEFLFRVNYGSEPESSDSDDDVDEIFHQPLACPRVMNTITETPEDVEGPEDPKTVVEEGEVGVHQPRDMFDFVWKPFSDTPVPPELRRETFSNSDVGPTSAFSDPYDVFIGIWDRQIMEDIVKETNQYAQEVASNMIQSNTLKPQSRISEWRNTCIDELYTYFAIILAMGIVVKSRIEEYWNVGSDVFVTPGFRALMSIKRFQLLSKCLHFNRNAKMSALELNAAQAKLYKIEPILSHLNYKFQSLYNLDQNIALDESLLQWKGLLNINQLIPNKKAKIGIKSYEICESKSGYLWRFEMHAHQKQAPQQPGSVRDPMNASTPSIVIRLTQGLENKGHTLWMDNYYNSPALARTLKSKGFDCVGTLRTNRQFVPDSLTDLSKTNMRPGQITGFTSGDVDLMVWRDQNRVATISTYHGNAVSVVEGKLKPILISDYNVMMGGVDKKDQMLAMYPIERKRTQIWYKKLFRRLLNVSVLNAFILLRHSQPSLQHRSFRMSLIKSLIDKHAAVPAATIAPAPGRDCRRHFLAEYPLLPGKSGRIRRVCGVCKKRVSTYCVACEQAVCMATCFVAWHSHK